MHSYQIYYSLESFNDLRDIFYYISNIIQMPVYANNTVKTIRKQINTLSTFPERCKIIQDEPWKSKEIRVLSVKKYNIYFRISRLNNRIEIIRIIYNGKDISSIVKQNHSLVD